MKNEELFNFLKTELDNLIKRYSTKDNSYKGYCVANPKFYKDNFDWDISEEDNTQNYGEYKEFRFDNKKFYWSIHFPENKDPILGADPVNEDIRRAGVEAIYAPYMVHIRSEEESKAYRKMRKEKGCINSCPFTKYIPENCIICTYHKN